MRILIVDDKKEALYFLETLLKVQGHNITSASNGAQAFEQLKKKSYDLIISDILMPVIDGFELCRKVKSDESLRKIPFIIYTATYTGPKDQEYAIKIGADRFITKPCEPEDLIRAIEEVMVASKSEKIPSEPLLEEEKDIFKLYNERLIKKLEDKMVQLDQEINSRKELEKQLREAATFWQTIYDSMIDLVAYIEPNGTIRQCNQAFAKFVGLNSNDISGQKCYHLIHKTDSHVEDCPLIRSLKSGGRETRLMPVGGKTLYVVVDPIKSDDGKITGFVHITRDITELKKVEKGLTVKNRLLEAIVRSQSLIIEEKEPSEVFDYILKQFIDISESEYGFIGEVLYTAKGNPYLKTYALTNISWDDATRAFYEKNAPNGFEFYNLNTLFGEVLKTAQPVISNDPANDPRRGGLPDGHPPIHSFLGLPLMYGAQIIGMLGVANRPGGYSSELIEFLQPYLKTCPTIINTIRIEKERQIAIKTLAESETKLKNIVEHSTNLFYAHDINHVIQYVSPQIKDLLGYEVQEALIKKWTEFASDNPINEIAFQKTIRAIETGEPQSPYELELVHKSGKKIHVEVRERPVLENGRTVAIVGALHDITERKKAEEALRNSEAKYRNLHESMMDGFVYVDMDGFIKDCNKTIKRCSDIHLRNLRSSLMLF